MKFFLDEPRNENNLYREKFTFLNRDYIKNISQWILLSIILSNFFKTNILFTKQSTKKKKKKQLSLTKSQKKKKNQICVYHDVHIWRNIIKQNLIT